MQLHPPHTIGMHQEYNLCNRNYPLQVNEMLQTELMDLPQLPNSACRSCVAILDDLLLFKETVLATQVQILVGIKPNIKTEDEEEPTNVAAYVDTHWCPTPGVSHAKTEESPAEPGAFEDDEELEEQSEQSSEREDSESFSDEEPEESEEEVEKEPRDKPIEARRKYERIPKMPENKYELKLETHFKSMGQLTCNICKAETSFIGQLVKHVRDCHETIKYFYCCGLVAHNVPGIYDHMELHLNPEKYKCQHCQKVLKSQLSLLNHIKRLHEVRSADDEPPKKVKWQPVTFENLLKQFKKAAQKTTPDQVPLIEEMRRRHLLICSICNDNAEYENMYYVFIHMMEVHNTRGFITCCGRRLAQKPYAYRAHLDPDTFKCDHCDKRFLIDLARREHTVRYHTAVEDYRFKCETCDKSYTNKTELIRHRSIHLPDDQRPHKCTECDKGFAQASRLREHVDRLHNVKSNFVCDVCGRGFTTNALLMQHNNFQHNEVIREKMKKQHMKNTSCQKCGKVLRAHCLAKHLKNACPASGLRYFCSVCNKDCKSNRALASHTLTHKPNWSLAYKFNKNKLI